MDAFQTDAAELPTPPCAPVTEAASSRIATVRGFALTPPVIGRIAMGHTVLRKKGDELQALPVRDDHFSITTLVQEKTDRTWEPHPLQAKLQPDPDVSLRAIPVRIAYNNPALSVQNRYCCFDRSKGRPHCLGNGRTAKRVIGDAVQEIDCPGVDYCAYGQEHYCKNMTRAYFQIEGQEDELGTFILRTRSHNSLSYLATRLTELASLSGNKLAQLPMMLVMVSKTSIQSYREAFQFADLVQRPGMSLIEAFKEANSYQLAMREAGLDIDRMENALLEGMKQSDFADTPEDLDEWVNDEELVKSVAGRAEEGSVVPGALASIEEHLQRLQASHNSVPDPDSEAAVAVA